MIPKLICFLFGHTLRYKSYPDSAVRLGHDYYVWAHHDRCPRCGAKL